MPCSNHGCFIKDEGGMRTNGRCHCLDALPVTDQRVIVNKLTKARLLYLAVNEMMATLGADGEITATSDCAAKVMDTLHKIDGGTFSKHVF